MLLQFAINYARIRVTQQTLQIAEELALDAENIIRDIGEENLRHMYSDSIETRINFTDAASGAEAHALTLQNLIDRLDEIIEDL